MSEKINIDFGPHAGGQRAFSEPQAVHDYAAGEFTLWQDYARGNTRTQSLQVISAFVHRWSSVVDFVGGNHAKERSVFELQLNELLRENRMVSKSSPAGELICELCDAGRIYDAQGAIQAFTFVENGQLQNINAGQLRGFMAGWALEARIQPASVRRANRDFDKLLAQAETDAAAALERYEARDGELRAAGEERVDSLKQMAERFQAEIDEIKSAIAHTREYWQEQWLGSHDHYIEQLKIRTPVELWESRAATHEANFKATRQYVWWLGLAGFIVVAGGALGSLWAARQIFTSVLGAPIASADTITHELVLAASITFLIVTLYIWLMRIVIRMMLSEHHLAIDARSRSAMAHTYLALLQEAGANSDEDRAIVLASLFRPVTDGIVKDDAIPVISPAGALAARMTG